MTNFAALTIQLEDLKKKFNDSRYTSIYGAVWRKANDLYYTLKTPAEIRTDYMNELIEEKIKQLNDLLKTVDLKDVEAIEESKLEFEDRLTKLSILSKDDFKKLINKAFALDDHGLDIFDSFQDEIIEAANDVDHDKLDRAVRGYIASLLEIVDDFIWRDEADRQKAIDTIKN